MIALVVAVFVASVLGSLHCVGMCGAFLALAIDGGGAWRAQATYHLGRLVTYLLAGGMAGAAGSALDAGGSLVGLQRPAALLSAALIAGFGMIALARAMGVKLGHAPIPAPLRAGVLRLQRLALALPPGRRALAIGLVTTLLPCGWLYAFVFTSAGTGSPFTGAAVMGIFWAGTLPAMATLGAGLRSASGPLRRHAPMVTALLVVAVGATSIVQRLSADPLELPVRPATSADLVREVLLLDPSEASCCDVDR